jgi:hypothetical protein
MCCSLEENQVVVVCNVCMYVGMHVHLYVCMYMCMCIYVQYIYVHVCIYVCIEDCGLYVVTIRSVLNIASGAFNGDPIASVVIPMYGSFSTIRSQLCIVSIISLLSLSVVRSVTYLDPTAFPSSTAIEYLISTPTTVHTYTPSGPSSMISTTAAHSQSTTALLEYSTTTGSNKQSWSNNLYMFVNLYVCMCICLCVG